MSKYVLIGSEGCGSAIVELAMLKAGAQFELHEIPYLQPGAERDRLLELNPLGQVPTLIMPDGNVMTESAAIIPHLADVFADAQLAPAPNAPQRTAFLRWLLYIVSEIYPTTTFSDDPARWQLPEAIGKAYKVTVDEYRMTLWGHMEEVADAPYFLGENFSAIDLYVAVMCHWRPGKKAFARHCPKLTQIAETIAGDPIFRGALKRNFASWP